MRVFRLARKGFEDLAGEGPRLHGGRWNSVEIPMVYTSESRGTALAEVVVHFLADIIPDYILLEIEVPDEALGERSSHLAESPAIYSEHVTRSMGDTFIQEGKQLGLWVPSVVVHGDWNLLLNPRHPAMTEVRIIRTFPFPIDPRLMRKA